METKTERLNLRLTRAQDTTLRRAAEAKGVPVSDYVLGHAVQAAEADLADRRGVRRGRRGLGPAQRGAGPASAPSRRAAAPSVGAHCP